MNAVQQALEEGCGALESANVFGEAFGNSGFRSLLPTFNTEATGCTAFAEGPRRRGNSESPKHRFVDAA